MADISDLTFSFCGVTLTREQLNSRLPMPTYKSNIKEHFMTDGADGNGIRVIEPLGAHISHCDFEFSASLLTASDLELFEQAYFDQRTPKTLVITIPGYVTTTYTVLFAADGYQPALQDSWVEYYEEIYRADFKLHILSSSVVVPGSGS